MTPATFDVLLTQMPPGANARLHWRVRHHKTRAARYTSCLQAQDARRRMHHGQADGPRRLDIEVIRGVGGGREQDLDNCIGSLKPVIDGVVDAGWLVDDKPAFLTGLNVTQRKDLSVRGIRVRVTVSDTTTNPGDTA